MNFIKSLIPNLFFWVGYGIMMFGSKLHKVFNTNIGKQLIYVEKFQDELISSFESLKDSKIKNKKDSFYIKGNEDGYH
jgi:hypothetical protein